MVLFVFMLIPLLFGRRAACHTLCWMAPFMIIGKKIGHAVKIPSLRIKSDTTACIDCGRCDSVSRLYSLWDLHRHLSEECSEFLTSSIIHL